ncbi:MAG TPA: hypothetical protein VFH44_04205 [Solirubrobacterales bacterium]|nr:hypothetical protein [Solirubrobacterales bacterium]
MLALAATAGGKVRSWTALVAALAAAMVLLAAAALAPAAVAKPPGPPELRDVATATGDNQSINDFSAFEIDVNASSGPAGEDAQGTGSFTVLGYLISGPVSCLKVTGNVAVLEIDGPFPSLPGTLSVIVQLTDNGGGGLDRFEYYPVLPEIEQDLDCETGAPGWLGGGPLIGRAVVFDAPPGPTSKPDCKDGGWARYGFGSQGLCIASVKGLS